jgi:hypothetical protein
VARTRIANRVPEFRVRFNRKSAGGSVFEIQLWMASKIDAISSLLELLMELIEGSHCIAGNEHDVDLVLKEALNNAVVHGNGMQAQKSSRFGVDANWERESPFAFRTKERALIQMRSPPPGCRRSRGRARTRHPPDPVDDGRISFERSSTEVYMRKSPTRSKN